MRVLASLLLVALASHAEASPPLMRERRGWTIADVSRSARECRKPGSRIAQIMRVYFEHWLDRLHSVHAC